MKFNKVKKGTILIDKMCKECKNLESHTSGGKYCRKCVSKASKKYSLLRAEKIKEYNKKWRLENKDKLKEAKRQYYNEVKNTWEYISHSKEYRKKHRIISKDKERNGHYVRKYKITLNDYNQMCINQNNSCGICTKSEQELGKKLAVDHCHTTGKVRGLLCSKCNAALGFMYEHIQSIKNMILYLEKHNKL